MAFVPYFHKKLRNGKKKIESETFTYLNLKQKSANHHKLIGILFLYRREFALLVFKAWNTLFSDTVQPDMSKINLVWTYSIDKIRKNSVYLLCLLYHIKLMLYQDRRKITKSKGVGTNLRILKEIAFLHVV